MNKSSQVLLFDGADGAVTVTSQPIKLGKNTAYSIQMALDGAATGDIQVQIANPTFIDGNADAIPDEAQWSNFGPVVNATASEAELLYDYAAPYYWVRVQYTATGGAGLLNGNMLIRGSW